VTRRLLQATHTSLRAVAAAGERTPLRLLPLLAIYDATSKAISSASAIGGARPSAAATHDVGDLLVP
jgi:hypothetical protein